MAGKIFRFLPLLFHYRHIVAGSCTVLAMYLGGMGFWLVRIVESMIRHRSMAHPVGMFLFPVLLLPASFLYSLVVAFPLCTWMDGWLRRNPRMGFVPAT